MRVLIISYIRPRPTDTSRLGSCNSMDCLTFVNIAFVDTVYCISYMFCAWLPGLRPGPRWGLGGRTAHLDPKLVFSRLPAAHSRCRTLPLRMICLATLHMFLSTANIRRIIQCYYRLFSF